MNESKFFKKRRFKMPGKLKEENTEIPQVLKEAADAFKKAAEKAAVRNEEDTPTKG